MCYVEEFKTRLGPQRDLNDKIPLLMVLRAMQEDSCGNLVGGCGNCDGNGEPHGPPGKAQTLG